MNFGLSKNESQILSDHLVPIWNTGATIWLFGSRARGTHNAFSDVDLLVEGGNPSKIDHAIAAVEEALEAGSFPFKVDIVRASRLAKSYEMQVMKERILFLKPS
jgi:predicted nucleotidyltransferase